MTGDRPGGSGGTVAASLAVAPLAGAADALARQSTVLLIDGPAAYVGLLLSAGIVVYALMALTGTDGMPFNSREQEGHRVWVVVKDAGSHETVSGSPSVHFDPRQGSDSFTRAAHGGRMPATLEEGTWEITAEHDGATDTRTEYVGGGTERVTLYVGAGDDGEAAGKTEDTTAGGDGDPDSEHTSSEQPRPAIEEGPPDGAQTHGAPAEIPATPSLDLDYGDIAVQEVLGEGSSGVVYRATTCVRHTNHDLAVKEPPADATVHVDEFEAFAAEADTWSKLDGHDHLVTVVDWGTEPQPWLAMEFMDGGSLEGYAGDLPPAQALWTALCITEAVYHAHRRGVAHLDLKPANVLFRTVDDGWDVPKVGDWGMAERLLDGEAVREGFSPRYAAPEQLDPDRGTPGQQSDVYSLGAVLYELFTGEPPYGGPSPAREVLSEPPPVPGEAAPSLPSSVEDVVTTAMATDPTDRYDDVAYMRRDLQAALDEQ